MLQTFCATTRVAIVSIYKEHDVPRHYMSRRLIIWKDIGASETNHALLTLIE